MRILVATGDSSGPVPPSGYGGLTRLAWAAALEFALLGEDVALCAPVSDPSRVPEGGPRLIAWPPSNEEVEAADCVYLTEADLLEAFATFIENHPRTLFVAEHNAPWLRARRAANIRHVVYRSDRLPFFDPGEARLFDQVLVRDEVGPPESGNGEILWLGRVHPDKGPDLLRRFALRTDRVIRVVGPSQMSEPPWPPNVIRQGPVDGSEKATLLRTASALVYTVAPTWLGAGEGVLTEAAACGLPILALSYSEGCPAGRLILEGVTGFRRRSPEALAALVPHVELLDKNEVHATLWPRLEPCMAARGRLSWMRSEVARCRDGSRRIQTEKPGGAVHVEDVVGGAIPALDALHHLWEFLVRHDERAKARQLLELRPWMFEVTPEQDHVHAWAENFDKHTRDRQAFRDFYCRSRGPEVFVPSHVDRKRWLPRAKMAVSFVGSVASTGSILEIGCHDGTVGYPVAVSYPDASYYGFDLNPSALARFQRMAEKANIDVQLHTEIPSNEAFDVVILAEVLEHVVSPLAELRKIAELLGPGGRLFLTTPWGAHRRGLPEEDPLSSESFHHLWAFTEPTLNALLLCAGLAPEWIGRVPSERPGASTLVATATRLPSTL